MQCFHTYKVAVNHKKFTKGSSAYPYTEKEKTNKQKNNSGEQSMETACPRWTWKQQGYSPESSCLLQQAGPLDGSTKLKATWFVNEEGPIRPEQKAAAHLTSLLPTLGSASAHTAPPQHYTMVIFSSLSLGALVWCCPISFESLTWEIRQENPTG